MKKKIFILFSLLIVGLLPINVLAQEIDLSCNGIFLDVDLESNMCVYAEYLYHQNVVSGNKGDYMGEVGVNRGQICKMIMNAFQIEEDTSGERFSDVSEDHTFFVHIMSLKNAGILDGYPDGTFRSEEVTRAQLTKLVVNSIQKDIFQEEATGIFPDVAPDHSLLNYIESAYISTKDIDNQMRIINGYPDGNFKPDQTITRFEAAKIVSNSMKFNQKENTACIQFYCQERGIIFKDNEMLIAERINTYDENGHKIKFSIYRSFNLIKQEIINLEEIIEEFTSDSPQSWTPTKPVDPDNFKFVYDQENKDILFFVTAKSTDEGCNSFDYCSFNVLQRLFAYNIETDQLREVYDFIDTENGGSFLKMIVLQKDTFVYKGKLYFWASGQEYGFSQDNSKINFSSLDLNTKKIDKYFEMNATGEIVTMFTRSNKPIVGIFDEEVKYFDVNTSKFIIKEEGEPSELYKKFMEENYYVEFNDYSDVLLGINSEDTLSFLVKTDLDPKLIMTKDKVDQQPIQNFGRFYSYFPFREKSPTNEHMLDLDINIYEISIVDAYTGERVRTIEYENLKNDIDNLNELRMLYASHTMYVWLE